MEDIPADILIELIRASAEPMLMIRIDSPDWPVVLSNPAFDALADGVGALQRPFPDVVEPMIGREMTREASAALRVRHAATLPVDVGSREFLLTLLPVPATDSGDGMFYCAYWRTAGQHLPLVAGNDTVRALARATRRIRDLSGDDAVTGLMNEHAFRSVLEHDWAVAAREDAVLGLSVFHLDDFERYRDAFGRHGADSCLRRIAKIVQKHLQRASDVAGRFETTVGPCIVVLSHGSELPALTDFDERIGKAVRSLGLHHPRSTVDRFVTVSHRSRAFQPRGMRGSCGEALGRLLRG
jgi:diguanylate cyclase (GGDEF)-like protein